MCAMTHSYGIQMWLIKPHVSSAETSLFKKFDFDVEHMNASNSWWRTDEWVISGFKFIICVSVGVAVCVAVGIAVCCSVCCSVQMNESFQVSISSSVFQLLYLCAKTLSHVRQDSFTRVPWLIHTCARTHLHTCHDVFTCVPWLIHMGFTCDSSNHTFQVLCPFFFKIKEHSCVFHVFPFVCCEALVGLV